MGRRGREGEGGDGPEVEVDLAAVVEDVDLACRGESQGGGRVSRLAQPTTTTSSSSSSSRGGGRTVLGRGHRPGVNVHVRVNLDRGDFEAGRLEQEAGRRGWRPERAQGGLARAGG